MSTGVFLYLQDLLVKLQALALDEIVRGGGHLICQVPQSTQGELQSGVQHSHHGFLLHNRQQLLRNRGTRRVQLPKIKLQKVHRKHLLTESVQLLE